MEDVKVRKSDFLESSSSHDIHIVLHFAETTAKKMRNFCRSIIIEMNDFIVKTITTNFESLEDDIQSNAFDVIGTYFDWSNLLDEHSIDNSEKNIDKSDILEVSFSKNLYEAVQRLCDKIPHTPEKFIENSMSWKVDNLIERIKKGDFEFLPIYKDFSDVLKAIEKLW